MMKGIFKLYILKLIILSLTIIFISFGASAKKTIYKCGIQWFKVEENKKIRSLFVRIDGEWHYGCFAKIGTDSFKCKGNGQKMEYYVLDELTKQHSYKDNVWGIRTFPCDIIK